MHLCNSEKRVWTESLYLNINHYQNLPKDNCFKPVKVKQETVWALVSGTNVSEDTTKMSFTKKVKHKQDFLFPSDEIVMYKIENLSKLYLVWTF